MSVEDKDKFLTEVEEKLEDDLTVSNMKKVRYAITDTLCDYTIQDIRTYDVDASKEELFRTFINAKSIEGRSCKTIERYEYIMNKLVKHCNTPIARITIGNIRDFLTSEKERGISDRTLEGYRNVFSSVFSWLYREGLIAKNPCSNLCVIKYQQKVRIPFSDTDLERLKDSCECIRDKAIVYFLFSTGARISEVCALNRSDIDFDELECKVLGKGNKERTVYLNSVAAMVLKKYLKSRKDDSPALFSGKGTDRLEPGAIRKMLKDLEARSGVVNVHPHRFRRTLATNLINHGMSIQEVAVILGHSSIDTTMEYVYIEKDNVKLNYKRYFN